MDSSFRFELSIHRANNIDLKSPRNLFIRCYISAGNNQRVKLETKEISSKSNLTWNQTFSLDCSGSRDSIERLKRGTITLELRCRYSNKAPFLNMINGSKLLGRTEIPWKSILDQSPDDDHLDSSERWVVMNHKHGCKRNNDDDVMESASSVLVAIMKAQELDEEVMMMQRKNYERKYLNNDQCGCKDCDELKHYCIDNYEFYAIGALL